MTAGFEKLIEQALTAVADLRPEPSSFPHTGARKRSLDAALLARAASRLGLDTLALTGETQLVGDGRRRLGFHQNMAWTLTRLDRLVTNDKELTKRILAREGIPVASGEVVTDVAAAVGCYQRLGPPVVVKPIAGSGGRGITVDVRSEADLVRATQTALSHSRRVLIEESIPSVDLRIMVVAGRAVAAMLRVPAHVEGDGVSTVDQLVTAKNRRRAANAYLRHAPITISEAAAARMSAQGLGSDSVLAPGDRFFFHYQANLSAGGDSFNITELAHPELLRLAERAAGCFRSANHAGVDILAERFDRPPAGQRCVVCEVNSNNDMPMHIFPLFGPSIDVGRLELEGYLRTTGGSRQSVDQPSGQGAPMVSPRRPAPATLTLRSDWPELPKLLAAPAEPAPAGLAVAEPAAASPRRLDNHWLADALTSGDWRQVRSSGRLIRARRPGHEVILERSRTSVFASVVGKQRAALVELLGAASIARCRAASPDLWEEAAEFCAAAPGPWNLRPAGGRGLTRYAFRREATLAKAWSKLAAGSRPAVIEQAADELACRLLLVGEQVAGCLMLAPLSLVGNGVSTVGELIAHKLAARASHPYLRHWPIRESLLAPDNLHRYRLDPTVTLPAGDWVWLSRSPVVETGAETVGYRHCPVPGLEGAAREIRSLVGDPAILAVTFCTRPPDGRLGSRHWAVAGIDPDPVIAEFAWPWAGSSSGSGTYRVVADALRAGQRYELPAGP